MKYYIFHRENNDFSDILTDANIKKLFVFKIKYDQHLILGSDEIPDDLQSYIMLKYGDDIRDNRHIFIDRKPVIGIDYSLDPKRPNKFKN